MLARMLINESPFAQMTREMDRMFARPVQSAGRRPLPAVTPAVNAWQDDNALHVEAELPGYRLEDVEILAHDDTLTLRGSRELSVPEGATLLRGERASGAFERTLTLPVPINVEAVAATLRDGVLHVTLPLTPEVKPRKIAIQGA